MYKIYVLSVIFIWSLLQYGQSTGEESLSARVSAVEQEVEELKNEAITRTGLIRLLSQGVPEGPDTNRTGDKGDNGDNQDDNGDNKDDNGDNKSNETVEPVTSPFTIIEARRELVGDQVHFAVKYEYALDFGLTIEWTSDNLNDIDQEYITLDDGTRETRANASLPDENLMAYENLVTVVFTASNGYSLILMMAVSDGDDEQRNISLPILEIEPSEFAYDEGKDFSFNITRLPEPAEDGVPGPGETHYNFQDFHLLDLDSWEPKPRSNRSSILQRVGIQGYPEYEEYEMVLKTSEVNYTGIIVFSTNTYSVERKDLVRAIWHSKSVSLHPYTQDGPFPSGYLAFYPKLNDSQPEEQVSCQRGGFCSFECQVMGDVIIDLAMVRLEDDGTSIPVGNGTGIFTEDQLLPRRYLRGVLMSYLVTPSFANTSSERFQCVATNVMGYTATRDILVTYNKYYRSIVPEESGIEMISNATDGSGIQEYRVTCKVKANGRDLLTLYHSVTFDLRKQHGYEKDLRPKGVSYDENNDLTVDRIVTSDPKDRLLSVYCVARNDEPDHVDYLELPVPQEVEN